MAEAEWFRSAFGPGYLQLYAHRDAAQAAAEVAGLAPRLAEACAATGLPVLDAACGAGRHLAALRAAGLPAFGFDLSPDLLAAAPTALRGGLARADLRAPCLADASCAAVLLLFTSFGYFGDAADAACLAALARALAPGGWLVLDLADPGHLRRSLVPESRRRTPDGQRLREVRRIAGNRVEKTVVPLDPGPLAAPWRESVRLYTARELAVLAAGAGLELAECWRSLRSPRLDERRLVAWLRPLSGPRSPARAR
jgi:SAM-dependent methyltransferase